MTLRKPSRMSRSLRLSSNAFSLTKGMLLELDFESLEVLTAWAASTVRSRATSKGSACCNQDESIVANRSRSRRIPLILTPSLCNDDQNGPRTDNVIGASHDDYIWRALELIAPSPYKIFVSTGRSSHSSIRQQWYSTSDGILK